MGNSCLPGCRWWCLLWRLLCCPFFPLDVLDGIWDLIESLPNFEDEARHIFAQCTVKLKGNRMGALLISLDLNQTISGKYIVNKSRLPLFFSGLLIRLQSLNFGTLCCYLRLFSLYININTGENSF